MTDEVKEAEPFVERNGYFENEEGQIVCILPSKEDRDDLSVNMIKQSPVMYAAICAFVEEADKGSNRAKAAYNIFSSIIKKIKR